MYVLKCWLWTLEILGRIRAQDNSQHAWPSVNKIGLPFPILYQKKYIKVKTPTILRLFHKWFDWFPWRNSSFLFVIPVCHWQTIVINTSRWLPIPDTTRVEFSFLLFHCATNVGWKDFPGPYDQRNTHSHCQTLSAVSFMLRRKQCGSGSKCYFRHVEAMKLWIMISIDHVLPLFENSALVEEGGQLRGLGDGSPDGLGVLHAIVHH